MRKGDRCQKQINDKGKRRGLRKREKKSGKSKVILEER